MVGTLYYMPPEQATGRGVTAQSDLYSLGAMLYELVTGRPPFVGDDMASIIGQHVNNVPVPPTWHNPSCPQLLEDLIISLLEKSPVERPKSATEVLAALNLIIDALNTPQTTAIDARNSLEEVVLTVTAERPDLSARAGPDGTVTILFSDIEASTALTERLGDQRAGEVLRSHSTIIRHEVATHGGYEVKSLGDGFMLAFSGGRRALQCAIAIQRSFASYSDEHPDHPIRVRIGLHAGEVVREVDDFFGKNVILASRIAGQANGGQILVSSLLKELTESAGDLRFGEGHDVKLKGLTGSTRIYPVIWDQAGPFDGSVGPATPPGALKRLVFRARRPRATMAAILLAGGIGAAVAGLLIFGVVSEPAARPGTNLPVTAGTLASSSATLWPSSMTRLVSPDGDVTVAVPAGAVESPVELIYQEVSPAGIPQLPVGYSVSNTTFDLSVGGPQADSGGTFSFLKPITISVAIGAEDAALAAGVDSNLVIQHFKNGFGWSPLPTEVNFQDSTVQAETDSLSIFALTVRKPPRIPTPTVAPTLAAAPTPTAAPTRTPTLEPTFTPVPTPTLAPTPAPSPTAIPTPIPTQAPTPTPTAVPQYLLETGLSPEGQGTVEAVPGGDNGRYPGGTVVLVHARCNQGFISWAGDLPDIESFFSNPTSVTMDRDRSVAAICAVPAPTPTPTPTPAPTATPAPGSTPSPSLGPSVWFGEVFTNNATLSLEKAMLWSPDSPEWLFYGQFQFNLESLGFEVVRGLSVPTKEELSAFDMVVVPIPNKLSLTDQFIDDVLDLVAGGTGLLVFVDEGLPYYVNALTQKLGATVYRGEVTSNEDARWPGGFDITDIDSSHPITRGIDRLQASGMAPVVISQPEVEAEVEVLAYAPEGTEASATSSSGPFAHTVAIEYGQGRVVIVADNFPFADNANSADARLGENAIRWLSESN